MSSSPEGDASAIAGSHEPLHILVVEDDISLATMLSWEIQELGLDVFVAGSCREALHLAKQIPFDLALVDADLPDGDGISLAESLDRISPETIVALCSGRHGLQETIKKQEVGSATARAVLVKPFPIAQMLELLPKRLT